MHLKVLSINTRESFLKYQDTQWILYPPDDGVVYYLLGIEVNIISGHIESFLIKQIQHVGKTS